MENVQPVIEITAMCLEVSGIGVIALGALLSSIHAMYGYLRKDATVDLYAGYRRQLSRAILLGLEFRSQPTSSVRWL